jgi:hypothetical protein
MTFFMDMGNGKQELVFIRYRAIKQLWISDTL